MVQIGDGCWSQTGRNTNNGGERVSKVVGGSGVIIYTYPLAQIGDGC